jgi:hypothetical protein
MRAVWAWRLMLIVSVPALALLATTVATQLPHAMANGSPELGGLLAWAAAVVIGVLLVLLSFALRRAGRTSAAILAIAVVVLPALAGLGGFLFIVLLFILKG